MFEKGRRRDLIVGTQLTGTAFQLSFDPPLQEPLGEQKLLRYLTNGFYRLYVTRINLFGALVEQ